MNETISERCTYVDRPEAGTVAGSHVLVESLDGVNTAELTELLVHVVGARARVIAEPYAKVLDLEGLLLGDLESRVFGSWLAIPFRLPLEGCKGLQDDTNDVHTDDFTGGLLDLLELPAQRQWELAQSRWARTSRNTRNGT